VLATLLPGFLIWGSQLLREAGIYFFIAVALNCAVRVLDRPTLSALALMAVAVGMMVTFRADVGALVGASLVVALVMGSRRTATGMTTGLGAAALVLGLVLGAGLGYSGFHFITHANLQQINGIRAGSSKEAASGFLPEANVSTAKHAATYLPVGSVYFLFGPSPWQVHGLRQLAAVPDVLIWWLLLPALWSGIRQAARTRGREVLVYLLPALALLAVLALLIANFGTAVRERMQIIVLLIPLISLGWSVRHPASRPAVAAAESSA
jgi:hypothetical protein